MLSDEIYYEECEIDGIIDIRSVKHKNIGKLIKESSTDKYVFVPKIKDDGKVMYYKGWYLANILNKLNELNGRYKNENII